MCKIYLFAGTKKRFHDEILKVPAHDLSLGAWNFKLETVVDAFHQKGNPLLKPLPIFVVSYISEGDVELGTT
jgi:hypothetical protein